MREYRKRIKGEKDREGKESERDREREGQRTRLAKAGVGGLEGQRSAISSHPAVITVVPDTQS